MDNMHALRLAANITDEITRLVSVRVVMLPHEQREPVSVALYALLQDSINYLHNTWAPELEDTFLAHSKWLAELQKELVAINPLLQPKSETGKPRHDPTR